MSTYSAKAADIEKKWVVIDGKVSNPAVEEEVLTEVASYGKQLGRIEDVLQVLLAHFHPEKKLTAGESGIRPISLYLRWKSRNR